MAKGKGKTVVFYIPHEILVKAEKIARKKKKSVHGLAKEIFIKYVKEKNC